MPTLGVRWLVAWWRLTLFLFFARGSPVWEKGAEQLSRIGKKSAPVTDGPTSRLYSDEYLHDLYMSGLRRVTRHATTDSCRHKIEAAFMRHLRVVTDEVPSPFEDVMFHTQCPMIWDEVESETHAPLLPVLNKESPRPPPDDLRYPTPPAEQPDWRTLSICYVMLVHDFAEFAIRIINAVNEPQHFFVIHIDRKARPETTRLMREFAGSIESKNVWILEDELRVSINWGGFSMVNATLLAMNWAWDNIHHKKVANGDASSSFDYLIDLSGTSYPIKSNEEIRKMLAAGKPGAVYMDVQTEANRPMPEMWQMFIECDDKLHRVARMPILRGMNMHVGSQWFALPRHVVDWYLHNPLPISYIDYAQHIVVADENYFATLFKNSPYCRDQGTMNLLFVLFDKWENERAANLSAVDRRKCLHPDPEHCGRSPTTLTTEYRRLLQVSRFMFARKFDPLSPASMELVADMERWRTVSQNATLIKRMALGDVGSHIMLRYRVDRAKIAAEAEATITKRRAADAAARAVCVEGSVCPDHKQQTADQAAEEAAAVAAEVRELLAAREPDVCVEMGRQGGSVKLRECDSNKLEQWFVLGPCTEGSNVTFTDDRCAAPVPGADEMFCMLQAYKGERNQCLDISGETAAGGAPLITWECTGQWNQLFRFLSDCSLSAVQPEFIGKVRGAEGRNVTLCVGKAPLRADSGSGLRGDEDEDEDDHEEYLDGAVLTMDACSGEGGGGEGELVPLPLHAFEALPEDGPEQLLYRWKQPTKRRRRL